MTTYLVQYRLVKLPDRGAEPDEWSSATSTMTIREGSAPLHAGTDQDAAGLAVSMVTRLATHAAETSFDTLRQ